ncbi:unnamed protein product [Rhizoctonia solani]|uniref:C3H1-type domain-containing protein n=1 Tax=Rhizoctonia solani TaxID=456999 RepID=A0A8H3CYD1_9AGAM|nr:unnamed protein product [Rhizoctonia solani]
MSANGAATPGTAPSFENFSFSFSRPSLLSRLNMNASPADPESSPSTGSTSAVTATTDSLGPEPTPSSAHSQSHTQFSSIIQTDQDMPPEEDNGGVNPNRHGLDRGSSSTPRAGSPIGMEIDSNGDPEIVEISSHSANGSRIPATYHDLPANHYFVAPPVAFPYPRSPVRRFPEDHPLHTQPSLFGYLPRAPPRSPRLDPLEILELESTRERNEWEQVRNELGRSRLERPSSTISGPFQIHSIAPSVPQTQTQVNNGNMNKATSQAPPSDDDYDSDSSDVELRIYNADPLDEIQTPSQPHSALGTVPPTPLGARPPPPLPPVSQSLVNGSTAHRSIMERLSQDPSVPRTPSATQVVADPQASPSRSNTATPAKRKIDDVDPAAQESGAKRPSPTPRRPTSERGGIPPPLRVEVDKMPVTTPSSSVAQTSTSTAATSASQTTIPRPTSVPSTSISIPPVAKSGNICRFHNRPPGRVCVRKDQCPDLHVGELQKPTSGASLTPVPAIEPSTSLTSAPITAAPPAIAPPMTRTPSLADAPPLGTNPSPVPRSTRPPCRFFSTRAGCRNGTSCPFDHSLNEQPSRPPSRQLAPSPIPPTLGSLTTTAPIPVHFGPKVPLPPTAASPVPANVPAPAATKGVSTISAPTTAVPLVPAPVLVASLAQGPVPPTPAPAPQPVGTMRIAQSTPNHPLPAKPPADSPTTPPAASPPQTKGKKAKGKAKAAQAQANATKPGGAPPNANQSQPSAPLNVKVKVEPASPAPNTTKAAKRKASGSQPKPQPQPTRLNTGTRQIKQEEVTLYDLVDDSPQEPSGSSVLLPELTGSQPRTGVPHAQVQTQVQSRGEVAQVQVRARTEVVQPQPRPIAPLPSRAVPPTASVAGPIPTSTILPPMNRPPPPPYRPPPPANPTPSTLSHASALNSIPAAPPVTIPAVPTTSVIPPTPVRPVPEQSAAGNAANGSNTNTSNALKAPAPNTQATSTPKPPTPGTLTDRLVIPVPPRPNPSPAPPRPDMASGSSPSEAQTQPRSRSRQASREPARPDSRGLARRMSPVRRDSRDPPRRNSREPERRSLMTRIDYRSNTYRPTSRSRSPPPRRYSPPPMRRRSPPPSRGRSPSPARYREWRSRSRSPPRRSLRERFAPRPIPSRRGRSRSWSPRFSRSPSRSPGYRGRSSSRSTSRSPSTSPPPRRQRYEPSPPVNGYTNASAYLSPEKNIPRVWEPEAQGGRPVSNDSSPSETMVIVDEPTRNSTPPPRNAMTALNDYDSFNQSRTMDISPMSSPARSYTGTGGGLGNRISDLPPPPIINYATPLANYHPLQEPRENLLTRMTGEPDLANRLAPASSSNRGQAPNRAQPANKATKSQPPLANRLGGGDSSYPGPGPGPGQANRNERRAPPRDVGVRGGKLMSRMTGK